MGGRLRGRVAIVTGAGRGDRPQRGDAACPGGRRRGGQRPGRLGRWRRLVDRPGRRRSRGDSGGGRRRRRQLRLGGGLRLRRGDSPRRRRELWPRRRPLQRGGHPARPHGVQHDRRGVGRRAARTPVRLLQHGQALRSAHDRAAVRSYRPVLVGVRARVRRPDELHVGQGGHRRLRPIAGEGARALGDSGQRHIPGRQYEDDGDRARQRAPRVGRGSGGDRRIARARGGVGPREQRGQDRAPVHGSRRGVHRPCRRHERLGDVPVFRAPRSKSVHTDGQWTLDELEQLVPASLAAGLTNPAPSEPPRT